MQAHLRFFRSLGNLLVSFFAWASTFFSTWRRDCVLSVTAALAVAISIWMYVSLTAPFLAWFCRVVQISRMTSGICKAVLFPGLEHFPVLSHIFCSDSLLLNVLFFRSARDEATAAPVLWFSSRALSSSAIRSRSSSRTGCPKFHVLILNLSRTRRGFHHCLRTLPCFAWQSRVPREVTASWLHLGYIARAWHWQLVWLNWASTT